MKIVIPMSGMGDRFRRAGYADPKPLIKVDGRPMIEHVINMFAKEDHFVFICNTEHLRTSPLESVLRKARFDSLIIGIEPHKRGPVHAVCQALHTIEDDEEVIVNYCDFGVSWDYADFLSQVRSRQADGAMSAYRGFHPHSLGSTYYAYIRHDNNWLQEIREKESFTDDRMDEYASSGTYYFARGALIKKYFPLLISANHQVGGEFYVSLVYNLLQRDGHSTYIYELEHFLQWGTPENLEEYQYWSDHFRSQSSSNVRRPASPPATYNLMLLAGRGIRFVREGYTVPKPLVPVAGVPMVVQALRCLPGAGRWGFVCLKEHLERHPIRKILESEIGDCDIKAIERVTEGQACTALLCRDKVDYDKPLLIAACDNGMTWDEREYEKLLSDKSVDVIVWTFRRHASLGRNPESFGWVQVEGIRVIRVSVKVPISSTPRNDHAIVGAFFFRRGNDFLEAANEMIRSNKRVHGEFYIDEVINFIIANGKRAVVFEIQTYLGWGTPSDLKTFEYWNKYFMAQGHPPVRSSSLD